MDVFEAHRLKAGALKYLRGGRGVAERERVRGRRRRAGGVTQSGVDRQCPFVELAALPDERDQSSLRTQARGDIPEGGDRIREEHRAEAADREVEAPKVEASHLGVA